MKTKNYKNGKITCKSYYKKVGKGYEVGFNFGTKNIFVGNFIHTKEANAWWTTMNHEIGTFATKYKVGTKYPTTRYTHFLTAHLYKTYYNYLNQIFTKYRHTFNKTEKKDLRNYRWVHRNVQPRTRIQIVKAA